MPKTGIPHFLNGQLCIAQGQGYRAGLDAVLLASSIQITHGKTALELGCGAGTALLCAAWKNPDASFVGVENQPDLVMLAQENAVRNVLSDRVQIKLDTVCALNTRLGRDQFDHVFFNPPFQDGAKSGHLPAIGRDTAFVAGQALLSDFVEQAAFLVKSRGYITLIHRAEKIAQILHLLRPVCGDIHILPILPKADENAHRVLVRGRKGVRTPATLLAPLVLHTRDMAHTKKTDAILRGKQPLVF